MTRDAQVLRDLGKRVADIAHKPIQDQRRELWRGLNSFERTPVPIYVRAFAFHEIFDWKLLRCEDPLLRGCELRLHELLYRDAIPDDFIIEPWLTVPAVYDPPAEQRWGLPAALGERTREGGAAAYAPALINEGDWAQVQAPDHRILENATRERVERLQDALRDSLEINLDRSGLFTMWAMDISTDLAKIRGLEQIMWDAYDRPEWLHGLLARMRDGILRVQQQVEAAGDYSLANHQNQAMPYARELAGPAANAYNAKRKDLWGYMAAQEFTAFGPDLFEEFMLQYQMPIMAQYGLVAYGCCEDLTHKIHCLRKIPNLRRIAVTPFADLEKCARQIRGDYIISWRPNPATMVSTGLDEAYLRSHFAQSLGILKAHQCRFDITLKDVETVSHQPDTVAKWVQILREELDKAGLG